MNNTIDLDDAQLCSQYDPKGMLLRIHGMPAACERAWQMAMDFSLPADYSQVNKIVILGMGGSAIGGDLVSSMVSSEARLPVIVIRDYTLPAFVDGETLVIASSYSGMTEETLAAFEPALKTGARTLVVTTGGRLKEIARGKGIPVFTIDYKAQPRAALPYSFLPILGFMQKLGFISNKSADVAGTVDTLQKLSQRISEDVPVTRNPAKALAQKLYGYLPVIYGAGIASEVARRWKTQINENSKAWAFFEMLPELNHNAVVGYEFPAELASQIVVIMLDFPLLPERLKLRYRVTGELLDRAKVSHYTVTGEGGSALSQMMSLVLFGDWVSYYLAILNRVDPSPVKTIDYLKEKLAKG